VFSTKTEAAKAAVRAKSDSGIFTITNQNFDIIRDIEAWRNNTIKEEEKNQNKQAKGDCSLADEEKEEEHPKSARHIKTKTTLTLCKLFHNYRRLFPIILLYSRRFTRLAVTSTMKVVNSEFIQTHNSNEK